MADALTAARELIETRISELRDELRRLEGALSGLGGSGTRRRSVPRRSTQGRSTTTTRRRGQSSRASKQNHMEALVAQARKTPTASNRDLAKVLGVSSPRVSQLLAEGRKTGRVSRRNGKLVVGSTVGKSAGTQRGKKSSRKRTTARSRGTRERAS